LILVVGVYFLLGLAVDLIAPRLPLSIEHRIAGWFRNLHHSAAGMSEEAGAVQEIVDRIENDCARLPYRFTVHVHDDPAVNAAALPGGHIVVFRGLLESVRSENELAFVMAHEMGHFADRDHLKGFGRSLVFLTLWAVVFGGNGTVGEVLADGINLTELGFSRRQEAKADAYAIDLLNCAYGHVGGGTDFFKKMTGSKDTRVFGHYFSSHPRNQERIDALNAIAGEKGYGIGPLKAWPYRNTSQPIRRP
jgi:Zn-dependent protease with chaperone function